MTDAPWYAKAFGAEYLNLYRHRNRARAARAVHFILHHKDLDPASGPVLDLCCGAGRHSLAWLEHARPDTSKPPRAPSPTTNVVGFDLSPELLASAARKTRRMGLGLRLVRGDMRRLPFRAGRFRLVINLFNSFGYFADDAENEAVFGEIGRVLQRRNAHFVFDHMNPPWLRANLEPKTERVTPRGVRALEERWIDEAARRVEKKTRLVAPDGRETEILESVRFYEPSEVTAMASERGIELEAAYGDFDASPLTDDSPRAVYIFHR